MTTCCPPTDAQLLEVCLYPLAASTSAEETSGLLQRALLEIAHDALGVFCAVQCFYIEILAEDARQV